METKADENASGTCAQGPDWQAARSGEGQGREDGACQVLGSRTARHARGPASRNADTDASHRVRSLTGLVDAALKCIVDAPRGAQCTTTMCAAARTRARARRARPAFPRPTNRSRTKGTRRRRNCKSTARERGEQSKVEEKEREKKIEEGRTFTAYAAHARLLRLLAHRELVLPGVVRARHDGRAGRVGRGGQCVRVSGLSRGLGADNDRRRRRSAREGGRQVRGKERQTSACVHGLVQNEGCKGSKARKFRRKGGGGKVQHRTEGQRRAGGERGRSRGRAAAGGRRCAMWRGRRP